ncbi:MAG TPA: hypothetical protein VJO33_16235, partial [Gemmatimonadaceae bacterium]|nr:hypothetical protein [Gemmatimonadaceae bacterium]
MVIQPHTATVRGNSAHDTAPSVATIPARRLTLLVAVLTFALAGCDHGSPFQANHHGSHDGGLSLPSLTRA